MPAQRKSARVAKLKASEVSTVESSSVPAKGVTKSVKNVRSIQNLRSTSVPAKSKTSPSTKGKLPASVSNEKEIKDSCSAAKRVRTQPEPTEEEDSDCSTGISLGSTDTSSEDDMSSNSDNDSFIEKDSESDDEDEDDHDEFLPTELEKIKQASEEKKRDFFEGVAELDDLKKEIETITERITKNHQALLESQRTHAVEHEREQLLAKIDAIKAELDLPLSFLGDKEKEKAESNEVVNTKLDEKEKIELQLPTVKALEEQEKDELKSMLSQEVVTARLEAWEGDKKEVTKVEEKHVDGTQPGSTAPTKNNSEACPVTKVEEKHVDESQPGSTAPTKNNSEACPVKTSSGDCEMKKVAAGEGGGGAPIPDDELADLIEKSPDDYKGIVIYAGLSVKPAQSYNFYQIAQRQLVTLNGNGQHYERGGFYMIDFNGQTLRQATPIGPVSRFRVPFLPVECTTIQREVRSRITCLAIVVWVADEVRSLTSRVNGAPLLMRECSMCFETRDGFTMLPVSLWNGLTDKKPEVNSCVLLINARSDKYQDAARLALGDTGCMLLNVQIPQATDMKQRYAQFETNRPRLVLPRGIVPR